MSMEEKKVIYTMMGVSKFYDKRQVLKDISLSYFYGAKIGVLGLNGAGKSSLLRIMAGVDQGAACALEIAREPEQVAEHEAEDGCARRDPQLQRVEHQDHKACIIAYRSKPIDRTIDHDSFTPAMQRLHIPR